MKHEGDDESNVIRHDFHSYFWSIFNPTSSLSLLMFVRATLPPSTLFADSVLFHRGYTISVPKA